MSVNIIQALTYSERQFVVVMPDEIVNKQRDSIAKDASGSIDWKNIAMTVAFGAFRTSPLVTLVSVAVKEGYAAWERSRDNGIKTLPIKRSEAEELIFPPGHPRDGVLYACHPADTNTYFTVATFHRAAFEHKLAEAVNLLMHLGATNFKVEHITGWSTEFASHLDLPFQQVTVKADAGSNSGSKSKILFEASLPKNKSCVLPSDMVWYPHEKTWQSVAKGRMDFGMNDFSLMISYVDDFGINADLKLKATNSGLDLGGKFEEHIATSWKIEGVFAPSM